MANFVKLNLRPDLRTLRQFGFVAFACFAGLAVLAFFEAGVFRFGLGSSRLPLTLAFGLIAVSSALFSLTFPEANRPVFFAVSIVAYPIGLVVSYVILAISFFFVVGIVSALVRLSGRDPLARVHDRTAGGYWTARTTARTKNDYFRQF